MSTGTHRSVVPSSTRAIMISMKGKTIAGDPEELIYIHAAEEGTEGGALVDVDPDLIRAAGYRWPVRISQRVAGLVTPTLVEERQGQSMQGRLWHMLWLARIALLDAHPEQRYVAFEVVLGGRSSRLWGTVDSTRGLAIHIITPGEC